jgi:cyclopropane-fatty-acyl-phospholipid synthase
VESWNAEGRYEVTLDRLIARGSVPDFLFRAGTRWTLRRICRREDLSSLKLQERLNRFLEGIEEEEIAIYEKEANEQHYELPTAFFQTVLGRRLKYSSGYFESPVRKRTPSPDELDRAEAAMLRLTAERAELARGQAVLELGCGWGSLSLYMAERFPGARITAVSNSRTQKEYIDSRAAAMGLTNLKVITLNVEELALEEGTFDRILSVEMFEHMRNYRALMRKLYPLLRPGGKMFIHIFSFRFTPYHFDAGNPRDWMARHFFAGGTMPSHELLPYCAGPFSLERSWKLSGRHYGFTLRAWLDKMDRSREALEPVFREVYGESAREWWNNWRAFFMICEELFSFRKGSIWVVSHYLFSKEAL